MRTQQGKEGGGESCEDGREAKRHRDEHQEQATARGAEPKIYPGKLELRVHQGGHACYPAYAGANRSAVR